ncbi:hypothetical protein KB976_004038 [Vibrio parahaemolyticus]|nr:hypothetical protein [Vibrio parahaemolyticus]
MVIGTLSESRILKRVPFYLNDDQNGEDIVIIPTWQQIREGDEVTWVVKSDYQADFRVLRIYAHPSQRDEQGEPVRMARLHPLNEERFRTVMIDPARPLPLHSQLTVDVPLCLLLPVVNHTLH